jgi:predicted  nucleic acid-binding Zn-ribbon protein
MTQVTALKTRWSTALLALGATLALAGSARAADLPTRLDQLNQREKQLLEKLDATQQRQRDIENQLEGLRRRKQFMLDEMAARKPAAPKATPAATP